MDPRAAVVVLETRWGPQWQYLVSLCSGIVADRDFAGRFGAVQLRRSR